MTDWFEIRAEPIRAIEHGVNEVADHFGTIYTGARTYDRIDYPSVEVLPNETARLDATTWRHSIIVNCYFTREREMDYLDDVLFPVAGVLDECLAALSDVSCITNYHPESITDFAGELDNTAVLLVEIRFRADTLIDPGEFD